MAEYDEFQKQDAFQRLIGALKVLPNVGLKSAQRMAYHLLQQKRKEAEELVDALQTALRQVRHCARCNTFCEGGLCDICADETRDGRRLMVVHMPADVSNIEAANCHDGLYFVLMGQINTALGMDVSAIALDRLAQRLDGGKSKKSLSRPPLPQKAMPQRMSCPSFSKPALQGQQAVAGHPIGRRIGICRCGNAGAGGVRTASD